MMLEAIAQRLKRASLSQGPTSSGKEPDSLVAAIQLGLSGRLRGSLSAPRPAQVVPIDVECRNVQVGSTAVMPISSQTAEVARGSSQDTFRKASLQPQAALAPHRASLTETEAANQVVINFEPAVRAADLGGSFLSVEPGSFRGAGALPLA